MKRSLTILSLALAACQVPTGAPPSPQPTEVVDDAAGPDEPVLRTYAVPAGRAEDVAQVLRRALSQGPDTPARGTVNQLDDGRLVVLAPASVHEGIGGLCRELEARGPVPPPPVVEISYWLVLARPGGDGVAPTIPETLSPALEEIVRQDGAAEFSLLESTRVSSLAGARGEAKGRHVNVEQVASLADDAIVADIELEGDAGSELDTRISLKPGELAVLGHAGRQLDSESEGRLYYVVRAEIR